MDAKRSRRHGRHPLLMSSGRRLWTFAAGCYLSAGWIAALSSFDPLAIALGLTFATLTLGVGMFSFQVAGAGSYLRAQVLGFEVSLCGLALMGVAVLIGPWAHLATAVLIVTCSVVWHWIGSVRRRWQRRRSPEGTVAGGQPSLAQLAPRPSVDMSAFELALLDIDDGTQATRDSSTAPRDDVPAKDLSLDDLCRLWRSTYVLLQQRITPESAMQLLAAREACLQELDRRSPGSFRAWLDSGAGPRSDPRTFFRGTENA